MKLVASAIEHSLLNSSWIRQMFEQGVRLKKQFGSGQVCDFSLGNPDLPPPAAVQRSLSELVGIMDRPFALGYMPNGGYPEARAALAAHLSTEQGLALAADDVVITCGAAGGLNVFFKTVLDPADEVIAFSPYFVEYGSYVANHGGVFKTVKSTDGDFLPDLDALKRALTDKTRAVLINSPNNPTGQVYAQELLQALADLLADHSARSNRPVYLLADEPYRFLTYDQTSVPPLLPLYQYGVVVSSFSKSLSLAGERVGYVVVSPLMEERTELVNGLILSNRILGFVNPPAIGQFLMMHALDSQVDAGIYARRRKLMADVLTQAGYEFFMPKGAFYFFPKAPGGDDVAFVQRLMQERVLAVPGSGFGGPGYFRLAFCVEEDVILRSAGGFARAAADFT